MNSSVCPFCPNITLDPLGHHAVSCRHGGDVFIRHNRLRSIFAEFCRRAHLSVRVEVGQGLSRVQSNSRPADVLVDAWERAKPAAFDENEKWRIYIKNYKNASRNGLSYQLPISNTSCHTTSLYKNRLWCLAPCRRCKAQYPEGFKIQIAPCRNVRIASKSI